MTTRTSVSLFLSFPFQSSEFYHPLFWLRSCIQYGTPTVLRSVGPSLFLKVRVVAGKSRSAEWQPMSPIECSTAREQIAVFHLTHTVLYRDCTVQWPLEFTPEAVNSDTDRLRLQFIESRMHELTFMKLRARSPQDTLLFIDCFAHLFAIVLTSSHWN